MNGNIVLEDGRVLIILPEEPENMEESGRLVLRWPLWQA